MLSLPQLRLFWRISSHNRRTLERRISRMCAGGLIEVHTINARLLNPTKPLFAWRPGSEQPDPFTISLQARSRWSCPATPTTVYVASRWAANLQASTSYGLPKPEHRDHDLLLAWVYVQIRIHRPQLAALWVGEHVLPKAGYQIKDPDAFLIDDTGNLQCVIESAGSYTQEQVESFHEHCVEYSLPYELW